MGLDKSGNNCWGPGLRSQWWDYSFAGDYFITICTKEKVPWLGKIIDQQLIPSESGNIASEFWKKIPQQFPNIELGAFVIMPDHMHGILSILKQPFINNDFENILKNQHDQQDLVTSNNSYIQNTDYDSDEKRVSIIHNFIDSDNMNNLESGKRIVATRFIASNETPPNHIETPPNNKGGFANIKSPMLNNNISRVIRWYKGACTFQIRKSNPKFHWQSRFHDHMIRNPREYHDIAEYIQNNPMNWGLKHPSIKK